MIPDFLNIKLLPWQQDVASQLFEGKRKYLSPPFGLERGAGRTYLAAALALLFMCNVTLDNPKVIVIDPICRFNDYLYDFIINSSIKKWIKGSPNKGRIWVDQLELQRYILFVELRHPEDIMGFFGNLLFILDGNGKTYPTWAEEIIATSISPDNCCVYRT